MLKFEKTLPVGLQLYSVRDFLQNDFEGTLKKIKDMGYDYVEPAGFYGMTAEKFSEGLKKAGLTAICAHIPYAEMMADGDKVVNDCLTLGIKYVAIPYLDEKTRPGSDDFENVLETIRAFGKKCADSGIQLLYHNHDFEFIKMPDGRYGLDYMYESVDASLLATELDCCWVNVAGESPADYVRKYAGRCPVVHLKDFTGQKTANMYNLIGLKETAKETAAFEFRPVGYGKQDVPSILKAATESGASYLVVEQDQPGEQTSLEAVEMSRKYLKSLGF